MVSLLLRCHHSCIECVHLYSASLSPVLARIRNFPENFHSLSLYAYQVYTQSTTQFICMFASEQQCQQHWTLNSHIVLSLCSLHPSITMICESAKNHKYWMCVRVVLHFVLSMSFPFYIHICAIFCISFFLFSNP